MIDNLEALVTFVRATQADGPLSVDAAALLRWMFNRVEALKAFQHPLGFVHVNLDNVLRLGEGEQCRLHLWPSPDVEPDPLGSLHDHAWSGKSVVILGCLSDAIFDASCDAEGPYEARRVHYAASNSFTDEGLHRLTQSFERKITRNHIYLLPPRIVHASKVLLAPTATLLFTQGPRPGEPGPLVYRKRGLSGEGTSVRTPLTNTALVALLERFARAAADSPGV